MSRRYWTLCTRDEGTWSPQFGDYTRSVVEGEADDYRREYRRKDLRIICTGDRQCEIVAAVAALNKGNVDA
jgi:hypothetical protein